MGVFSRLRKKEVGKLAPAETRACSHDLAIRALVAEIRTLTARIDGLQSAFSALNAFRVALEAKTWIAFHRRRGGSVAGGCAGPQQQGVMHAGVTCREIGFKKSRL